MSDAPFLAEIKMVAFNFAPRGWAFCNGQLLPIAQNTALFSLLGTTYGGNGQTTFALPDLRGRIPLHPGGGSYLGDAGGEDAHTLTVSEMPAHTHAVEGTSDTADERDPSASHWAANQAIAYSDASPDSLMGGIAVSPIGGSLPHSNLPPYLVVGFVIALEGIFPSRS